MGDRDLIISQIRQRLEILYQMVEELENQPSPGPGPGTSDYDDLSNKPSINGVELKGNKTAAQLSLATTSQLNGKVDKVEGSSLMTSEQASKLEGIEAGAEVNVQADWSQTDSSADDYIKNKPTIPDLTNYYTKTQTDAEIQGAITELDVPSTSTTGHYVKSIAQVDGLIEAVAETLSTSPTAASEKPITSGAVYTALSDKITKSDVFGTGTTIANNTDLDTLTTIGLYRCTSYNSAGTLTNCPTHYAFQMEVTLAGSANHREQIIYEGYPGANTALSIYTRIKYETTNTWTPWYKFTGTVVS